MDFCPALTFSTSYQFDPLQDAALERMTKRYREGKLGFLDLPCDYELLQSSVSLAETVSGQTDHMIVAGIGGSSLGLRALLTALAPDVRDRISIIDSPDEKLIRRTTETLDPETTSVTVITKSGGTAETISVFMRLHDWLPSGIRDQRITAVTDPHRGDLRRLAKERGWASLPVPPAVGGRYSVLSPVGIFPAVFTGIDVEGLMLGADRIAKDFFENGPDSIAATASAAFLSRFGSHPVHVFMPYTDLLRETSLWFSQLWAESLAKAVDLDGAATMTGQTPLACRGPADQHSLLQLFVEGPPDKAITLVTVEEREQPGESAPNPFNDYPAMGYLYGKSPDALRNAEAEATHTALVERGLPVDCIVMPSISPSALGELMMFLETVTALTGFALNIDPMNQPGVERSKILTYAAMERPGY